MTVQWWNRISLCHLAVVLVRQVITRQTDSILSCGVDYITVTSKGQRTESSLSAFGRYLVGEQRNAGEDWREFRFSGYRGETCGPASFGVRYDSQIVRLSSSAAAEHWCQAFMLSTNVTRLDIQVTVLPEVGPTKRLSTHHRQVRRRKSKRGRPQRFKFWYGPSGPEAATFGSRQSNSFGRAYDKGIESGLPEFAGSLRYEQELKKALAVSTALELEASECVEALIAQKVKMLFLKSGVGFETQGIAGEHRWIHTSSVALLQGAVAMPINSAGSLGAAWMLSLGEGRSRRRAQWLTNAVRPSVRMFMDQGRSDVVLRSLGLCLENGALVSSRDELWSNFEKER